MVIDDPFLGSSHLVNYDDLITTSPWMMVSKVNYSNMALFQVSELLEFTQIPLMVSTVIDCILPWRVIIKLFWQGNLYAMIFVQTKGTACVVLGPFGMAQSRTSFNVPNGDCVSIFLVGISVIRHFVSLKNQGQNTRSINIRYHHITSDITWYIINIHGKPCFFPGKPPENLGESWWIPASSEVCGHKISMHRSDLVMRTMTDFLEALVTAGAGAKLISMGISAWKNLDNYRWEREIHRYIYIYI